MTTKWFTQVIDEKEYKSLNGWVMKREYGKTPNDNDLNGRWVLRNSEGEFIDFDQYRNDLMERHSFQIH